MKAHCEGDGTRFYELEPERGEDLEAIEDEGTDYFDVQCEGDELKALVGCLAAELGISGRFSFGPVYDNQNRGIGFELCPLTDKKTEKLGEVATAQEYSLPAPRTEVPILLSRAG